MRRDLLDKSLSGKSGASITLRITRLLLLLLQPSFIASLYYRLTEQNQRYT